MNTNYFSPRNNGATPDADGIKTEAGRQAMADLRALFATFAPSLAKAPPPPNPHGMKTEAGRQAIADFEAFIEKSMPVQSQAIEIPPDPVPPGGIKATMLRKLAGDGALVPETVKDTPAANRTAVAMGCLDRMAAVMAQAAEQAGSDAGRSPLDIYSPRKGPRP